MSARGGFPQPVLKVELKRADIAELIFDDPVLATSPLVQLVGRPALIQGTLRRVVDKAVLMQQGEPGTSLFLVMAGDVRLFARRDRDSAELGVAHRGELLGECEAVEGTGGRRCSAIGQGKVDVLELPRELLLVEGKIPPELAKLLKALHSRRMKALDEMSDFLNRW